MMQPEFYFLDDLDDLPLPLPFPFLRGGGMSWQRISPGITFAGEDFNTLSEVLVPFNVSLMHLH